MLRPSPSYNGRKAVMGMHPDYTGPASPYYRVQEHTHVQQGVGEEKLRRNRYGPIG